jgi:hypothetical protein
MVLRFLQKWERTLTRRDGTQLFVKFFGLIILLSAVIPQLVPVIAFIVLVMANAASNTRSSTSQTLQFAAVYFGPSAIQAAVGLCFIRWSGRIVDKAGLAPEKDEIVEALDLRNIEITLVAALGLYFIADGFGELCTWSLIAGFNYSSSRLLPEMVIRDWHIPPLVDALVKLTIGILLVLRRVGIVAMLRRVHA